MKKIRARDIYFILNEAKRKKIIVYGIGHYANEAVRKLRCLDINVAYCIEEDFKNIVVECPVKDIYSLLLEKEDFYVFIAKNNVQECVKTLEGMGLEYVKDYDVLFQNAEKFKLENTFALDPTFGYSLPYEETKGKGIKIFGDISVAEYVIGILGGSTSDPCAYRWKSWGEILYERAYAEGRKIAVVIGAVCGFSSSEELFRLIRDILPLRPNIVISYSGVNDSSTDTPYLNWYQKGLYRSLSLMNQSGKYEMGTADRVCLGVTDKVTGEEKWIKNQRIMYTICREFNIRYIAFFQPTLVSKIRGKKDKELYYYIEENEKSTRKYYIEKIKEQIRRDDMRYINDACEWFDDMDGIFYDICHVYEKGNQRIANKMYEYVFGGM